MKLKLASGKRSRGVAALLSAAAVAGAMGLGATPAATASEITSADTRSKADTKTSTESDTKLQAAGIEAWGKNPGDFIAVEKALKAAGAETVMANVPGADLKNVTATEAQAAYDEAQAAEEGDVSTKAIDIDAFGVSSFWTTRGDPLTGEVWYSYIGVWDFKDDYNYYVHGPGGVGMPDTEPVDGVAIGMNVPTCMRFIGDTGAAFTKNGYDASSKMSLRESGEDSVVFNVHDGGHAEAGGYYAGLLPDSGGIAKTYRDGGIGDPDPCSPEEFAEFGGSFFYEHNVFGGGTWTFTLSLGAFEISYGEAGTEELQKADSYSYFKP
ncbi:hypothetical protein [Streptomyces sp. TRM68367]|uniref:hypothetical protein n=1 Tax=Streptomyces sp. TRM68367 TaxID=2758415 RepID=UPI00165C691C|nr:hypothetical protein [Streptomyces sp. TRM68367]MBC9731085.1 hypothetical protein [Streptomyces sp. TRM68367]